MGTWVGLDGGTPRAGHQVVHVADPSVSLEELTMKAGDVWRTQPAVRKVVNFGCRNLASIPMHVYKMGEGNSRERDRTSRAAKLLRKPAPFTTPYKFWHTIHVDNWLTDRWCFVVLDEDRESGYEAMLFRIPPSRFTVQRGDFGEPIGIEVTGKNYQKFVIPPNMAVFDQGYSSGWGDPVSPLDALAETLNEAKESRSYRRDLLKNGARVDAVIERPKEAGGWTDTAWERFSKQFATYKVGGGQAGGVPILEDGMKLVKVEAFSPQTLETLEQRKMTDAEVSTFWHIPPELLGVREGTYSNLDAFRQMLYTISLGAPIVAWEQALDVMLLGQTDPGQDDLYIEAHVDAKLRGSWAEQTKLLTSAVGAPYMTRNEARARLNMKAIPGGDEMIVPLNVLVGGLANPSDTAPDDNGKGDNAPAPKALAG